MTAAAGEEGAEESDARAAAAAVADAGGGGVADYHGDGSGAPPLEEWEAARPRVTRVYIVEGGGGSMAEVVAAAGR